MYGNEHLIGPALKDIQASGVKREELWVTSKLWNDKHAPRDVEASCEQVPIPFSVKRSNYLANLKAAVMPPLTAADMQAIAGIDRMGRLVKGQVFLWKAGQSWEDLWDLHGTITSP